MRHAINAARWNSLSRRCCSPFQCGSNILADHLPISPAIKFPLLQIIRGSRSRFQGIILNVQGKFIETSPIYSEVPHVPRISWFLHLVKNRQRFPCEPYSSCGWSSAEQASPEFLDGVAPISDCTKLPRLHLALSRSGAFSPFRRRQSVVYPTAAKDDRHANATSKGGGLSLATLSA